MAKKKDAVALVVQSAFAIGGEVKRPGDNVKVDDLTARNLLDRGKAVLATGKEQEAPEVEPETTAAEQEEAAPAPKPKRGKK